MSKGVFLLGDSIGMDILFRMWLKNVKEAQLTSMETFAILRTELKESININLKRVRERDRSALPR